MFATAMQRGTDVIALSEPNIRLLGQKHKCILDSNGDSGFYFLKRNPRRTTNTHNGIVVAWLGDITAISCYVSPNCQPAQYTAFLDNLSATLASATGKIVLMGDFNARSPAWGDTIETARGRALSELLVQAGLAIVNHGDTPTFEIGKRSSYIDVTAVSTSLMGRVGGWQVLEEESGSDHKHIVFTIEDTAASPSRASLVTRGWNARKFSMHDAEKSIRNLEATDTGRDLSLSDI